MSEIVESMPGEGRQGRPPTYNWDELFNGEVYKLFSGEDFNGDRASFRVLAHRTAPKYGLRVKTQMDRNDERAIYIQAYDPAE